MVSQTKLQKITDKKRTLIVELIEWGNHLNEIDRTLVAENYYALGEFLDISMEEATTDEFIRDESLYELNVFRNEALEFIKRNARGDFLPKEIIKANNAPIIEW